MNAKALGILIVISLFLLSGCVEEDFQATKEKAKEFAGAQPQFQSFLQRYPYAEITAQRVESEQSNLFEEHPILEKATQRCGKEFKERTYWYVRAKHGKNEIATLINSNATGVECMMGEARCSINSECNDFDACTIDRCDLWTNACEHTAVACVDNDGCCPQGCYGDNDCKPTTGTVDKVLETPPPPILGSDQCSNDLECEDGDPCTENVCKGSPKTCRQEEIYGCSSHILTKGNSVGGFRSTEAYQGQEMQIELENVTNSIAQFTVYDANGNFVLSTAIWHGEYLDVIVDGDGAKVLKDSIYLHTTSYSPETGQGWAELVVLEK